jgi:hypothetical protein
MLKADQISPYKDTLILYTLTASIILIYAGFTVMWISNLKNQKK